MILYFYDLVFKTKKDFNRKKRRFYYRLNKLNLPKNYWLNKSVLLIPDKDEYVVDQFFKEYKKSEREIKIYKIFTTSIEEI